jgi:hypothetical protein
MRELLHMHAVQDQQKIHEIVIVVTLIRNKKHLGLIEGQFYWSLEVIFNWLKFPRQSFEIHIPNPTTIAFCFKLSNYIKVDHEANMSRPTYRLTASSTTMKIV